MKQLNRYDVVVGDANGRVTLWNFCGKGRQIFSFPGHFQPVERITIRSNNEFISECSIGIIIQWSIFKTETKITQIKHYDRDHRDEAFSKSIQLEDGRRLTFDLSARVIMIEKLVVCTTFKSNILSTNPYKRRKLMKDLVWKAVNHF